jgi:hydroxyacylglutathione hydrolase
LAQELGFNSFFRLTEPGLIETLRERVPALPRRPSPREVFLALRELRNSW